MVILAAGLTPAWQQTLAFSRFRPGGVNRAHTAAWCASGKVLNVGAALHGLGAASRTLSIFGGAVGQLMRAEFDQLGTAARWVETQASSRVCTTILDEASGTMTELVENARPISSTELDEFAARFAGEARQADYVILTGSLPQQTPANFYRRLMESTSGRVLMDVRGEELKMCLPLRPYLVKPNREELGHTVGCEITTNDELRHAMQELRQCGAQRVLVSHGAGELWLLDDAGFHTFHPSATKTVNPIGCGDCLTAGVAAALSRGAADHDAIRYGMAAAAENASRLLPARINRPSVDARFDSLRS